MHLIRKNRHDYPEQVNCHHDLKGVDLNRNYPFMFSYNQQGQQDVCNEEYRGPSPLSEPETQAVSNFVKKWSNLKIVINFHAYGNLFIVPFNFDDADNQHL